MKTCISALGKVYFSRAGQSCKHGTYSVKSLVRKIFRPITGARLVSNVTKQSRTVVQEASKIRLQLASFRGLMSELLKDAVDKRKKGSISKASEAKIRAIIQNADKALTGACGDTVCSEGCDSKPLVAKRGRPPKKDKDEDDDSDEGE
jgi:hypothetical protein